MSLKSEFDSYVQHTDPLLVQEDVAEQKDRIAAEVRAANGQNISLSANCTCREVDAVAVIRPQSGATAPVALMKAIRPEGVAKLE